MVLVFTIFNAAIDDAKKYIIIGYELLNFELIDIGIHKYYKILEECTHVTPEKSRLYLSETNRKNCIPLCFGFGDNK